MNKLIVFLLFVVGIISTANAKELPSNIVWQSNDSAPIFASDKAIKGGVFRTFIDDFPPTFRQVGPSSNSSFRGFLDSNALSLIELHPQTEEIIPALATHWAVAADNKTAYFKLNPNAKWSDGKPVTADDYVFMLVFMRSEYIVAPWYNNHYSKEIVSVTKYDDYTISVELGSAKPSQDVIINTNLSPLPKHFHQLNKDWVQWANWRVAPVTGPYQISDFHKGRYIDFSRVENWWGENERYYKNRFNVDKVRIKVVRNQNIAWNMFLKGDLDSFALVLPEYWHDRAFGDKFDKGWIRKYWFYNITRQPSQGLFLNLADPLFADKQVREAIAYALNIDKMNQTLLRGDYDRLPNFHTGYGEYTNPNIQAKPFDLAKANQLLDEAGWQSRDEDGVRVKASKRLAFKVTYSRGEHSARLALLKEEALKAGIEINLQLLTGASAYHNIMEKKHQAAWLGWSTGFRPAYWQHFHSDNANKPQTNNITNTADSELDALIMQYRESGDSAEKIKLAHQIQQKVADIGAYIPTYMVPYTREGAWAYVQVPDDILPKYASQIFDPMGLGTLWLDPQIKEKIDQGETLPKTTIVDETYRMRAD